MGNVDLIVVQDDMLNKLSWQQLRRQLNAWLDSKSEENWSSPTFSHDN